VIDASLAKARLWLLGHNFAVLPNVYRRTVHARGFARDLSGAAKGAADGGGQLASFFTYFCFLHGPCSKTRGLS
jgi:hypothetical protein